MKIPLLNPPRIHQIRHTGLGPAKSCATQEATNKDEIDETQYGKLSQKQELNSNEGEVSPEGNELRM